MGRCKETSLLGKKNVTFLITERSTILYYYIYKIYTIAYITDSYIYILLYIMYINI